MKVAAPPLDLPCKRPIAYQGDITRETLQKRKQTNIHFHLTPECPGTHMSLTEWLVERSFNAHCHCHTNVDEVVTA